MLETMYIINFMGMILVPIIIGFYFAKNSTFRGNYFSQAG